MSPAAVVIGKEGERRRLWGEEEDGTHHDAIYMVYRRRRAVRGRTLDGRTAMSVFCYSVDNSVDSIFLMKLNKSILSR